MRISRKSRADLPRCQKLLQKGGVQYSEGRTFERPPIHTAHLQYIPTIIARLLRLSLGGAAHKYPMPQ